MTGILLLAILWLAVRPAESKEPALRPSEATFRRYAAEFKRLRRAKPSAWVSRFNELARWFSAHADVVIDRPCAEIARRFGPPDDRVHPAHESSLVRRYVDIDDPKGELLAYVSRMSDAIGTGTSQLLVQCHDDRVIHVWQEMTAS